MSEMKLEPGWLARQMDEVAVEVATWPDWMQGERAGTPTEDQRKRAAAILRERADKLDPPCAHDYNHQGVCVRGCEVPEAPKIGDDSPLRRHARPFPASAKPEAPRTRCKGTCGDAECAEMERVYQQEAKPEAPAESRGECSGPLPGRDVTVVQEPGKTKFIALSEARVRALAVAEKADAEIAADRAAESPAPATECVCRKALADRIVLRVCEIPDRFSPDDQPEMMLATPEELHRIVMQCTEETPCQCEWLREENARIRQTNAVIAADLATARQDLAEAVEALRRLRSDEVELVIWTTGDPSATRKYLDTVNEIIERFDAQARHSKPEDGTDAR